MSEPRRAVSLAEIVEWAWPGLALVLILGAFVLIGMVAGSTGFNRTVTEALIMTVIVVGLYIFIGNSGILSFGHTAFMAIGAYASAWATCCPALKKFTMNGLPPFLLDHTYDVMTAAMGAGLLAAAFAFVTGLALMRLSGVAATIASLALLFIVHVTYSNWESVTRGKGSLVGLPTYVEPWVALCWAVAAIAIAWIYRSSRFGLLLRSAREEEVASRACGVNVYLQRLIAFVISAFVVGIGGVLHAHYLGTIQIDNYFLDITLLTLAMLVVGGQRSLAGAVVGVIVMSAVVEIFRQLENGVAVAGVELALPNGVQQLALAAAMLLSLILRPSGLMGGREIPWPFSSRPGEKPQPASDGLGDEEMRGAPTGGDRLAASGIHVSFDGLNAVDDLDLTLTQGRVLGLIGPNGAGKTTLVNVLTGFQRPNKGAVSLDDLVITSYPPRLLARAGVSRTFQSVRLFRALTVMENLEAAGIGGGLSLSVARRRGWAILEWLDLTEDAFRPCNSLPYGHERLIGIARGLALAPRFLLLDEPAAGLSEAECANLMKMIAAIPERFGCGVLLIEHNMEVVMGVCDEIQVIAFGRSIALGAPAKVQEDPRVIEAYLGTSKSR